MFQLPGFSWELGISSKLQFVSCIQQVSPSYLQRIKQLFEEGSFAMSSGIQVVPTRFLSIFLESAIIFQLLQFPILKLSNYDNLNTFLNLGFFVPIENCLAKVFFSPYFPHNFRTTSDIAKLRPYLKSAALN